MPAPTINNREHLESYKQNLRLSSVTCSIKCRRELHQVEAMIALRSSVCLAH